MTERLLTLILWLCLLLACSGPSSETERDRENARAAHRWIHEERAYALDLDIDNECAPCHLPSHLQLFRQKHQEMIDRLEREK